MGSGRYDHPAFLTPQCGHVQGLAGASAVVSYSPISAIRLKSVSVAVRVAGTTASAAAGIIVKQDGTAKGTISLSTNIAGVFGTLGSLDVTVPANGTLSFTNGADATFVGDIFYEYKIDPQATWTGNN